MLSPKEQMFYSLELGILFLEGYTLESLSTLTLWVTYEAGCEEHNYKTRTAKLNQKTIYQLSFHVASRYL